MVRNKAGYLAVVAFTVMLPGCALFQNKNSGSTSPILGSAGVAPAKFPTSTDPLVQSNATASRTNPGAVLAGRVIDSHSRPPANTFIRLVSVDAKDNPAETDVAVTPEGYFTIQGLQTGKQYKLLARSKAGEKMLAGISYATAPNIRVLIQVKEEFVGSTTPEVPSASPSHKDAAGTKNEHGSAGNKNVPTLGKPGSALAEPQAPPLSVPPPLQPPIAPGGSGTEGGWVPGIASEKSGQWPPLLDIPNPKPKLSPPTLQIPNPKPPTETPSFGPVAPPAFPQTKLEGAGPTRVPSCVLVGKQLVNLALNDVNGEGWEFRVHRRGKLVLLDFWSTNCIPCRQTMPLLAQLQARIGPKLEVVGVALENGGSPQEQSVRVGSLCQKLQVNHRQLLSTSAACPTRRQFAIRFVPTLVLVDENGWILWRHEGQPDATTLAELERLVRQRL
ncbi:MAG: TlpA family protein disulfide reductase [Gemmataceae bacterium]|nr:TlpA family protein disulfide reductase [Gemmataceae bacterium]MCI0742841.1 TlpA family protein disulfide reductase [Gemmataceae bacterium]